MTNANAGDTLESGRLPFPGWERSFGPRADRRPLTILFIPRFSRAYGSRVPRALRRALAAAGGYTFVVEDPASEDGAIVDVVFFREAILRGTQNAREGGADAGFARTMLESVESSFCMILDGSDSYVTSNARPLLESVLQGGPLVIGAVWRTHRPCATSSRWRRRFFRIKSFFSRETSRDALSGLLVVDGSGPSAGS